MRKTRRTKTSLLGILSAGNPILHLRQVKQNFLRAALVAGLIILLPGGATAQYPDAEQPAASEGGADAPGTSEGAEPEAPADETAPERKTDEAAPAEPSAEAAPSAPAPTVAEPGPVTAAPTAPTASDTKGNVLRIATTGGAYLKSQEQAFFIPFGKHANIEVKAEAFDGTFDTLKSRGSAWDLVNLDGATSARACSDKLLEPLDPSLLEAAAGGVSAVDDYLPGAIQPCAFASVAWSAVVVYDKGLKREPSKLADFFDLRRFPGKRLLPKGPKFTLELALLADGVAPADVYSSLSTPEGQNRAFAKLASLKNNIAWFDKPSEMFEQISRKDMAMGLAFNGRAFMTVVSERRPLGIIWDRQIYAFDYWAIPHGAKNVAGAKEFIRFATTPAQLAEQARWLPYGPARKSAARLPIKHAELDMEMKPWLPTTEANMQGALAHDPEWWSANEAQLTERFSAWLEGREATPQANTPQ